MRMGAASSLGASDSFFFFSSRRRHTRYIGDWSSDVCSSDLFLRLVMSPHAVILYVILPSLAAGIAGYTWGGEIGRASCRERVWVSVVGVAGKRKKEAMDEVCAS